MLTNSVEWFADRVYWEANRSFIWSDRRIEMSGTAVSNIVKLLGMKAGESVLDLACGFGRHSLVFAEHGFDVTAVDLNPDFIEEADANTSKAGKTVRFICADMREFREPESYNNVVLLYNSFGYFKERRDDERVIRNCFDSLLPGGKILISVMGREIVRRNMNSREQRDWWEKDGVVRLEEYTVEEDWSWATIRWTLLEGNDRQTFEYGLRLYSEEEMIHLLSDAGFVNIQIYGSMKGTPYDEKAHHLVATACKSK